MLFTSPASKNIYGIFNDSFPPILDGVTLTVENYARWLRENGMSTCVVTPWNPVKFETNYDVVRYFSLPIQSRHPYRYGYPKADPFIWHRLKKIDFRLVHAHCPFSSGRLAVYTKKHHHIPLIGTFHSKYRDDLEHSFQNMKWFVPVIMKRILDFFNSCDEVWIPQAQVEETVREYGYKGKLTVVENGNDFASIPVTDLHEFKQRSRKELGINDNEISLLFVGQHIWEKGLDVIVETLRELKGKVPFKMNFIGVGYAFNEIKKRIEDGGLQDYVKMHGIISDREELRKFYAAADLFLFPSFYDNAPLVVREAAAMGTPSILLENSTAAEVIFPDKNGFLIKKNPHDMSERIIWCSRHPYEMREVALGARNSLVRSWEDVVEEVKDRYSVICKNFQYKG